MERDAATRAAAEAANHTATASFGELGLLLA